MDPPPPPPAVPAPAAAGGAGADDLACCWWHPSVSRRAQAKAQLGMGVAVAAFALFALTLEPATFANLPAHCVTTPTELLGLRYKAAVLLLYAVAQASAATASLVVVPPSLVRNVLGFAANVLGVITFAHLVRVVIWVLWATGGLCFGGTVDLRFPTICAATFLSILAVLWFFALPHDP